MHFDVKQSFNMKEIYNLGKIIFVPFTIIIFFLGLIGIPLHFQNIENRKIQQSLTYKEIQIIKLRIDDESEYHITFSLNNKVYSYHDLTEHAEITLTNGNETSISVWNKALYPQFKVSYPIDKIIFFED